MKTKLRAVAILIIYLVIVLSSGGLAYMAAELRNFFMISIVIFIGYWFIFRSDYLYNSFILLRYKNKKSYYKGFLCSEAYNITFYVTAFVLVTVIIRFIAPYIYPDELIRKQLDTIKTVRIFAFEILTIINLLLLRFTEQLLSMLHKRITGNLFYIFYVIASTLAGYFVSKSPHSMNLFILGQLYRQQVQNITEFILSYVIMLVFLAALLKKLKVSSVRV